jgi:hypothetical protein
MSVPIGDKRKKVNKISLIDLFRFRCLGNENPQGAVLLWVLLLQGVWRGLSVQWVNSGCILGAHVVLRYRGTAVLYCG